MTLKVSSRSALTSSCANFAIARFTTRGPPINSNAALPNADAVPPLVRRGIHFSNAMVQCHNLRGQDGSLSIQLLTQRIRQTEFLTSTWMQSILTSRHASVTHMTPCELPSCQSEKVDTLGRNSFLVFLMAFIIFLDHDQKKIYIERFAMSWISGHSHLVSRFTGLYFCIAVYWENAFWTGAAQKRFAAISVKRQGSLSHSNCMW